jgi:hypothetical protein
MATRAATESVEKIVKKQIVQFAGKVKIRIKLDHRINRIKPVTTEP